MPCRPPALASRRTTSFSRAASDQQPLTLSDLTRALSEALTPINSTLDSLAERVGGLDTRVSGLADEVRDLATGQREGFKEQSATTFTVGLMAEGVLLSDGADNAADCLRVSFWNL